MSGGQGNEKGLNPGYKETFNIAYAVAKGHCICFLPFFRTNFGSEALGFPGLMAFAFMLLVGCFGRIPEMVPFLGVWAVAMLCQRAITMRAMRQGVVRHSRYEGDVDTKLIKNAMTVKQVVEPLACVIFGLCFEILGLSHGFAMYVGFGRLFASVRGGNRPATGIQAAAGHA